MKTVNEDATHKRCNNSSIAKKKVKRFRVSWALKQWSLKAETLTVTKQKKEGGVLAKVKAPQERVGVKTPPEKGKGEENNMELSTVSKGEGEAD